MGMSSGTPLYIPIVSDRQTELVQLHRNGPLVITQVHLFLFVYIVLPTAAL